MVSEPVDAVPPKTQLSSQTKVPKVTKEGRPKKHPHQSTEESQELPQQVSVLRTHSVPTPKKKVHEHQGEPVPKGQPAPKGKPAPKEHLAQTEKPVPKGQPAPTKKISSKKQPSVSTENDSAFGTEEDNRYVKSYTQSNQRLHQTALQRLCWRNGLWFSALNKGHWARTRKPKNLCWKTLKCTKRP